VSWSWVVLTFFGSVYMFLHGIDFAHYLNYWKRSIQIMDMDVSLNGRWLGWVEIGTVTAYGIIFCTLFFSYKLDQINDGAGVTAHALARSFTPHVFMDTLAVGGDGVKRYCKEWVPYHAWQIFGFFIQVAQAFVPCLL
jgi:hypothetical protein